MPNRKYYHCSPALLVPGDLILPGGKGKSNYKASDPLCIYLTSRATPHFTVLEKAIEENWYVYEVKPQGKITIGIWDDYISESPAQVINRLGNARGIAKLRTKFTDAEKERLERYKAELKKESLTDAERENIQYDRMHILYESSKAHKRCVVFGAKDKKFWGDQCFQNHAK